jgi:hypothetical protein
MRVPQSDAMRVYALTAPSGDIPEEQRRTEVQERLVTYGLPWLAIPLGAKGTTDLPSVVRTMAVVGIQRTSIS